MIQGISLRFDNNRENRDFSLIYKQKPFSYIRRRARAAVFI